MKIVKIEAQNFMKLRNISLALNDKGLIQVTGKNGQGKSTLLRLVEWLLEGPTAISKKLKKSVVRNGADRAWGQLELSDPKLGDFLVTRTVSEAGTQNLDVFDEKGNRVVNQQGWLDTVFTGLTFDPLAFAGMDTDEQIEELKRLATVELDYAALEEADRKDYEERAALKKERAFLENQIRDMTQRAEREDIVILDPMPKEKVDEAAIFQQISEANLVNQAAHNLNQVKQQHKLNAERKQGELEKAQGIVIGQKSIIEGLREQLKAAEKNLVTFEKSLKVADQEWHNAQEEFEAAPEGQLVDVAALTQELRNAQRTNRAIDTRAEYDRLHTQLEEKERAINARDMRMEDRDKMRKQAIAEAKLPVDGLSFDERQVYFARPNEAKLPLGTLGEGEQIRISTLLGIAMNPTLSCMCIQHGEALDEDGLKTIEQLAVDHDFQVLMARVETSGGVGIVIEDGRVAADNYRASYTPTKAKLARKGAKA